MRNKMRVSLWILLLYTLAVILWGAWVRISHSGDGCGDSWPLCEGQFIPSARDKATWIEFSHRLTSGLYGLVVIGLYFWGRRLWPSSHPVRTFGLATLILMLIEALFGAVLVKKGLVGQNDSLFRVIMMSLHFLNSAFLVGSSTAWALAAGADQWKRRTGPAFRGVFAYLPMTLAAYVGFMGLTGTFAALSTTLFPSLSLQESLMRQQEEGAHFLLHLRTLHPVLGVFVGAAILMAMFLAPDASEEPARVRRPTWTLAMMVFFTSLVGGWTLVSLSPIPLKIIHLLLAHLVVIGVSAWIFRFRYEGSN